MVEIAFQLKQSGVSHEIAQGLVTRAQTSNSQRTIWRQNAVDLPKHGWRIHMAILHMI